MAEPGSEVIARFFPHTPADLSSDLLYIITTHSNSSCYWCQCNCESSSAGDIKTPARRSLKDRCGNAAVQPQYQSGIGRSGQ